MAFTFTDDNAKDIIASGRTVLIDFWATWCGPCKALGPIIDKLAGEYPEDQILIGKYNTDEQSDLCQENRVTGLPALLFFKNGKMAARLVGMQKEKALRDKIDEVINM